MQVMFKCIFDAVREPVVDGHLKRIKPVIGFRLNAQGVTDNFFGIPVKDDGQVEPAPRMEFDLGHVDAPELIGALCAGFATEIAAFGFEAVVGLDR